VGECVSNEYYFMHLLPFSENRDLFKRALIALLEIEDISFLV